jgi:hypothetical protein
MGCAPGDGRAGAAKESATSEQPATPGPTAETDPPTTTHPDVTREQSGRRMTWLLPALAFVVGVVLGAVVVGAITSGDSSRTSADTSAGGTGGSTARATPAPSASRSGDLTVTVPAECAALAGDARDAASLLEQAATAARDLDAGALADVARRMQDARDRLNAQAEACRGAAPSASVSSS